MSSCTFTQTVTVVALICIYEFCGLGSVQLGLGGPPMV